MKILKSLNALISIKKTKSSLLHSIKSILYITVSLLNFAFTKTESMCTHSEFYKRERKDMVQNRQLTRVEET